VDAHLDQHAPVPPGVRRGPSTAWYWIAGAVTLVGLIAAVVLAAVGVVRVLDRPDGFSRAPIPGSLTLSVTEPDSTMMLYYEGDALLSWDDLTLEVTGPTGDPVPARAYELDLEYDAGEGGLGRAFATFHAATTGDYRVSVVASATAPAGTQTKGFVLAVGESLAKSVIRSVIGGLVVALVAVIAGPVIAIITYARRSAAARALGNDMRS